MNQKNAVGSSWLCSFKQNQSSVRNVAPNEISVLPGYQIEVYAEGLDTPIGIDFTENGDMLIADSGLLSKNPKVILLKNGQFEIIADGFNVPITGITYHNGEIYVAHRGIISIVDLDGTRRDIISGLPSYGDYSNNKVTFGPDNKMYFGQGTATNSGVVGLDNQWVMDYSFFHDNPGSYIMLNGQNFQSKNMLIPADDVIYTGAFSPFGVQNSQKFKIIEGVKVASGSLLRANPDGSNLQLLAWGFRNPYHVKFDQHNRLFITNQGADNRGSRPIANAPDEFQLIMPGTWYGWPDYAGGESVTLSRFSPISGPKLEHLLTSHPSVPPKPYAVFPDNSNIMGFDYNKSITFGTVGDAYLAEFGSVPLNIGETVRFDVGYRVTRVDMSSGEVTTFAINKSGFPASTLEEGGFGRPADVVFGPDTAMYVVDFSSTSQDNNYSFVPNTGVIWRIKKV